MRFISFPNSRTKGPIRPNIKTNIIIHFINISLNYIFGGGKRNKL